MRALFTAWSAPSIECKKKVCLSRGGITPARSNKWKRRFSFAESEFPLRCTEVPKKECRRDTWAMILMEFRFSSKWSRLKTNRRTGCCRDSILNHRMCYILVALTEQPTKNSFACLSWISTRDDQRGRLINLNYFWILTELGRRPKKQTRDFNVEACQSEALFCFFIFLEVYAYFFSSKVNIFQVNAWPNISLKLVATQLIVCRVGRWSLYGLVELYFYSPVQSLERTKKARVPNGRTCSESNVKSTSAWLLSLTVWPLTGNEGSTWLRMLTGI